MVEYTAPASKVLHVLHVWNPAFPGKEGTPVQEATSGRTVCGLDMTCSDLWLLIERRDGDRVCPQCCGAPADEEASLW